MKLNYNRYKRDDLFTELSKAITREIDLAILTQLMGDSIDSKIIEAVGFSKDEADEIFESLKQKSQDISE